MSLRAMQAVWDYSQQQGTNLLLLLAIADGINTSSESTFPAVTTLAYKARIGGTDNNKRRRVQRVLLRLIADGELIITPHTGHTSEYVIPILPSEQGYMPIACDVADHDCNRFHTPLYVSREELALAGMQGRQRQGRRSTAGSGARAAGGVAPVPQVCGQPVDNSQGVAPVPQGGGARAAGGAAPVPQGERRPCHPVPSMYPDLTQYVPSDPTSSEENQHADPDPEPTVAERRAFVGWTLANRLIITSAEERSARMAEFRASRVATAEEVSQ